MLGDEIGDDFWMLGGDVGGLTIVGGKIEELPVRLGGDRSALGGGFLSGLALALGGIPHVGSGDEMPAGGPDAGLGVSADLRVHAFEHVTPATDMRDEGPVRPRDVLPRLSRQQGHQASAFHLSLHGRGGRDTGQLEKRRGEVNVRREGLDVHGLEASG